MSMFSARSFIFVLSICCLIALGSNVFALETEESVSDPFQAYRYYADIPAQDVAVPTVLELPLSPEAIELPHFLIRNLETESNEPYYFKYTTTKREIPVSISSSQFGTSKNMLDGRYDTYDEFPLVRNGINAVTLVLNSETPIVSSRLTIQLSNHVALPATVEIVAIVNGQPAIVVAEKRLSNRAVDFPTTTSDHFEVRFKYSQPLRIAEFKLHQESVESTSSASLRFLAQPKTGYRVYFSPDRIIQSQVGESGNLSAAKQVRTIASGPTIRNPLYTVADSDQDTVPDIIDNCVSVSNLDQADVDQNGRGDVCDDFDLDGKINSIDTCPNHPNARQEDEDGDGVGDVCDGEESRITEKYPWLPWLGIGFAALILVSLFALTALSMRKTAKSENTESTNFSGDSSPPLPPSPPPQTPPSAS